MPDLGSFSVLGRGGDAKHPVSVFFCSSLKVPSQYTFLLSPFRVLLWSSLAPFPGFIAVLRREEEGKTGSHYLV